MNSRNIELLKDAAGESLFSDINRNDLIDAGVRYITNSGKKNITKKLLDDMIDYVFDKICIPDHMEFVSCNFGYEEYEKPIENIKVGDSLSDVVGKFICQQFKRDVVMEFKKKEEKE
jgi:hypothetical protein